MGKLLEAGKIVTTHGIRGEMKIDVWCDSAEFLKKFEKLWLADGSELDVERARVHKQALIIQVKNIDNIDKALAYVNKIVYIDKDDAKLSKGVFFIDDLVGLDVIDADNEKNYGRICDVLQNKSNDSYGVKSEDGTVTYIPAISDVIVKTDLTENKMYIRPIEGLFE